MRVEMSKYSVVWYDKDNKICRANIDYIDSKNLSIQDVQNIVKKELNTSKFLIGIKNLEGKTRSFEPEAA